MIMHRTFLALMSTLWLLGCGTSAKTHYYTLNTPPPPAAQSSATGPIIVIGPVTLPDLVDRPQLVLRTSDNQVSISDTHRWAQSLKRAVAQAVAENLAREINPSRVQLLGQSLSDEADLRIAIDILRFESTLGVQTTIEAKWTVRAKNASKPFSAQRKVHETVTGNTHADLIAAHSRAITQLSHAIALTLQVNK